jgi:membrane associated rhomboid family serine protease
MPPHDADQMSMALPKPGKGLMGVLVALLAIWLMFALAINWGGAGAGLFDLFCGNNAAILHGQIWRLVTAPLMHMPSGSIGHIIFALLGLYFLSPSLEETWGTPRFLRFLLFSGVLAYALQMLVVIVIPSAAKLVPYYWFGAMPVVEAVAIAWAMSFRGQTVNLMFILPISSTWLIVFVIAVSVLRVIALSHAPEGLLSPFGGMFAGWLLGGGTPSPLRRFYLRFKLGQLEKKVERETERTRTARKQRVQRSGFKVIEGGSSPDNDDEPPSGPRGGNGNGNGHGGNGQTGPNGRWLN